MENFKKLKNKNFRNDRKKEERKIPDNKKVKSSIEMRGGRLT